MNDAYSYEADWRPYAFPRQKARYTSEEEIKSRYKKVELKKEGVLVGGIPIISNGKIAYVDNETTMTIVYGETGSKKSRILVAPTICINAEAGESMIIPDIKGEFSSGTLATKVRGKLEEEGYNIVYLDFREMNSDGYNFLEIPYRLYRENRDEEAGELVSDLCKALGSIYKDRNVDPFWESTAADFLYGLIFLLFDLCDDVDYINFHTIKTYTSAYSREALKDIVSKIDSDHLIITKLRSVLAEPERTLASTLATVSTFLEPFVSNDKLLNMLSHTTFDIKDLYKKKTVLFLILPDEKDTYMRMAGIIIQQINSCLIREAYRFGGSLPRRVNFICDEFCNYMVPNMKSNISASRSRNIRWMIVCQSKKQLESTYVNEYNVIEANCSNVFFLRSSEIELLEELSNRAGKTSETNDGTEKNLISIRDLQSLKKGWNYTEVYFTNSSGVVYVTKLPDIDQYEFLKKHNKKYEGIPKRDRPNIKIYTVYEMEKDINRC